MTPGKKVVPEYDTGLNGKEKVTNIIHIYGEIWNPEESHGTQLKPIEAFRHTLVQLRGARLSLG